MNRDLTAGMLLSVLALCNFPVYSQPAAQVYAGKIAFIRDDAVWTAGPDGRGEARLTGTDVQVDDFRFSPTLRYLAYSTVVGTAEEPGIWDSTETPPERAICSIVVLDLATDRTLLRTDSEWVYIARWLPGDTLLYYNSDGFAVDSYFSYHPSAGSVQTIPVPDDRLIESEFTRDGSLEAFVMDYGRSLHLYSRKTRIDRKLVSKKGLIADVAISGDVGPIAFVEVQQEKDRYFDALWLLDLSGSECRLLDRSPAHPKSGGVNYLAWSTDGTWIGMFYPPEAIAYNVQNPSTTRRIKGRDFAWISDTTILFGRAENTYLYDIGTQTERLLKERAGKAVFLRR